MKQLEITTNKRLLIVEYPSIDFANGIEKISEFQENRGAAGENNNLKIK